MNQPTKSTAKEIESALKWLEAINVKPDNGHDLFRARVMGLSLAQNHGDIIKASLQAQMDIVKEGLHEDTATKLLLSCRRMLKDIKNGGAVPQDLTISNDGLFFAEWNTCKRPCMSKTYATEDGKDKVFRKKY